MEGSENEDPNTVVVTGEVKGAEMGAHNANKSFEKSVEIQQKFTEGATNSATLPEDDPDAFNTIVSASIVF
ncbi:hypothetical protein BPOR_1137g00020 [Botrytis porri]|uniref:Uncharacterized protein n=1 Tax=Botrytis porri TaxID=87229 RepID=A0A4Z1K5Q3_9HELO|nr:hypothetical protein BPOR_1137g00020 [Botrytis porri]